MLSITDLSYSVDGRPLIAGASARIPTGHKVGLVGRNGSGKTTLFRLIRGELVAEGGTISLPSRARIGGVAQEVPSSSTSLLDTVLAAVKQAGVKLQMGFNRRFDANFARVRQAVTSGEIGTPRLMHIISRDPAPPPPAYIAVSGGMFLDMTIHDFDMARFLLGEEVTEVYAAAGVLVDPAIGAQGDVDSALVTLKFASGAMGVIDNCRQAVYGYDQRVEILGSAGSASTGNIYPNAATISTAQAVRRDLPLNFFMERYTESYVTEMQAFVDAVRNDTPVPATGEDARAATALALAARRSFDEGAPVDMRG